MLICDLHYLALGVPGPALPADLLTNCGLPTVDNMVFDSLHGERLFKDERDYTPSPPPCPKEAKPCRADAAGTQPACEGFQVLGPGPSSAAWLPVWAT